MEEYEYFNAPIQVYAGFLSDSQECLNQVMFYAIYKHSLELEGGNELQRMKESAYDFNVTLGDVRESLSIAKRIVSNVPHNSPMVGINKVMFWEYYNEHKTEFEKVCLLGFIAFKSIVGSKPYCKVTNKFWLSRMDGKAKQIDVSKLSDPIKKYNTRRYLAKIKRELEVNWNLVQYGYYTRGFYVSFKLDLDKLVFEVEKKKKMRKDMVKSRKEKARADALKKLGAFP